MEPSARISSQRSNLTSVRGERRHALPMGAVPLGVVQFRIERDGEQLPCAAHGLVGQAQLLLHVAEIVAVVGVVPRVVREDEHIAQVADFGARGRVEREGGLVPHPQAGIDVAGHVQRVTDPRHQLAVAAAAVERERALRAIPQMHAVVMCARVIGRDGEHLFQQKIRADAVAAEQRCLGVERLGLDVVGEVDDDLLQRFPELLAVRFTRAVHQRPGLEVRALVRSDRGLAGQRLLHERLGALAVAAGPCHAPVRHGVAGLELQAPSERALSFVEPVRVQQRVALVEPRLDLGIPGGDGEMRPADAVKL